ncbi:MAG: hypothetical protein CMJ25_10900 [Phycisphaerae bacterium]|nr:hypothetical protein [Phycisphaerae bacterium]|tara:strand:+ start:649 stop:1080 length:432 start_codon:yes stop_codon:yes gene_type:complete
MATQKITMGRHGDTDYEAKKSAALSQAGMSNPFVMGVQSVYQNGTGQASKASRHPQYANVNITTGDALDGEFGNFKPLTDNAGNQIMEEPQNLTGYLAGGYSQTIQPQVDSEMAGQQAAQRVQMMAQGRQYMGLNDRQQMYQV